MQKPVSIVEMSTFRRLVSRPEFPGVMRVDENNEKEKEMIERAWYERTEEWKEITKDRAARELANRYGDDAVECLEMVKELQTRYAYYRYVS